jgi:uncharacterized Ntn-hydrolase superfamily protein
VSIVKLLALAAACALTALGVAACGGSDDSSDQSAAVTITSPQQGAMEDGTVTAAVDLSDFQIDAADVGKGNVEGKGHLHFSMDGGQYDNSKYSGANGKLAEQLGTDGQYSPSTTPTVTYKGLPPGEHTLKVDVVNNDHSPTGVSDSVTFTVG